MSRKVFADDEEIEFTARRKIVCDTRWVGGYDEAARPIADAGPARHATLWSVGAYSGEAPPGAP
ncbi:hypothetical protein, partial [Methylobacterium sp. B1]|uniref:hypothetical protein n=1 Tax=Methylobacterium sp. B1 TaxID=91459 RepID=UPI001AEBCD2A